MKGNKKILVIAVLLLLIAVSYSTYAIYKTSVTANANVTAATWSVVFKDGQDTIVDDYDLDFGATDCVNNSHVADGKIAPGATCTKTVQIDITGSEVDVAYTVTADSNNITATKNNASVDTTDANEFTATVTGGSGTIAFDAASKTATITVQLAWGGVDDSTATPSPDVINDADTALNGATITVPLTLVAKQDTT